MLTMRNRRLKRKIHGYKRNEGKRERIVMLLPRECLYQFESFWGEREKVSLSHPIKALEATGKGMLLGKLRKSFSCESKSHAIYHLARVIRIAYLWTRAGGVEIKKFYLLRPLLFGHLSCTWGAANRLCVHIYLQKLREWCDFGVFHACFRTCRRIASTSGSFFPKNLQKKCFIRISARQRNALSGVWTDACGNVDMCFMYAQLKLS